MVSTKNHRMFVVLTLLMAVGLLLMLLEREELFHAPLSTQSPETSPVSNTPIDSLNGQEWTFRESDMSDFRKRFLEWDKANSSLMSQIGLTRVDSPEKFFIYRCDTDKMSKCGGWADRVKGVLLTYIIANLTGRVFKIDMIKPPCDLLQFVTPNLVNWSLPVSFHAKISKKESPDARIISKTDSSKFLNDIQNINFTDMLESKPSKYIYFKANLDYSQGLQTSQFYGRELAWMANITNDQILSTVYKIVFRLSPPMQVKMGNFMAKTLPTSRHRLICAHVRMGANPSIPNDSDVRFRERDLVIVWQFLSTHSVSDNDKIFFISDSENAVRLAKSQLFGHRMVESGGPINHVDLSRSNFEQRCAGMEKVIFDQHVLMQCDVLLVSFSGLSRMAAYIRGSNQGLYCLLKLKKKIVPCETHNLRSLYKVMG